MVWCHCRCHCSFGVAQPVENGVTAAQEASDFLSVTCSTCSGFTTDPLRGPSVNSFPGVDSSVATATRKTGCKFFASAIALSLVLPAGSFCFFLPLFSRRIYDELWTLYFRGIQVAAGLAFAEQSARISLGSPLRAWLLVCVGVLCVGVCMWEHFVFHEAGSASAYRSFIVVMPALMFPLILRLVMFCKAGLPWKPVFYYLLIFQWGATPPLLCIAYYSGVIRFGLLEEAGCFLLAIAGWTLAPFLIKPVGYILMERGSPKSRFVGPVLWVIYCDAAFASMGPALFMRNPLASLSYAASLVPALGIQLLRGLKSKPGSCCGSSGATVFRLRLLLEALSAVLGRSAAYTQYFCMQSVEPLRGVPSEARPMLFPRDDMAPAAIDVNIYRFSSGSAEEIVVALCGAVSVWSMFAVFCALVPCIWRCMKTTQVFPDLCGGEDFYRPSEPSSAWQRESSGENEMQARTASDPAIGADGWILGGGLQQTQEQQFLILRGFLVRHWAWFLTMVIFQFTNSILCVYTSEVVLAGGLW